LIANNEDKKPFYSPLTFNPPPSKRRDEVMVNKLAIEKARP